MMNSLPPAPAALDNKKKKKSKTQPTNAASSSAAATHPTPSTSTAENDSLTRAIQDALDHVRATGAIATQSDNATNPSGVSGAPSATKPKKKRAAPAQDDSAPATETGSEAQKTKRKKKKHDGTAVSNPSGSAPTVNQTTVAGATGNMPQLVPAYIPAQHEATHIPIDPALTANDQVMQHQAHSQASASTAFMGALTNAAATLQHEGNPGADAYMFNQEGDLPMLGSNDDILRAFQGFDMTKFAGALKSYSEALATENAASGHPQSGEPGPSTVGVASTSAGSAVDAPSGSASRPRAKKIVAPQPTGQVVNTEHADILATHWLNPAKLAGLVKEQGLVYKKGKFSAIEEHQIETALQNYANAKGLTPTEIDSIIFSKGKKAKEEYSTFWSEVTRSVPQRPIIAVYHHVRRTHHPMKQQGKWTPEEDAIVIAAVAELGQKWEQVSQRVGRMSSDCRDRYRNHLVDQDARVVGPWTKEEEDELTKIVLELTVERGLQADNDVLWSAVSERMGGRRTRQQVRIKWTDALNKRVKNSGERPRWNAQDAYILVHKVASMPVQDDTEIDWKLLPDPQWNLWSAHQLQRRWFGLKKTLKDADTMPHSEIIAILQSKFREPPEQPNAPRRYETKKSRSSAIGREFITDEDDSFDDFADPNDPHGIFSEVADGSPIDPELVREAQQQLEAVLEMASRQAVASGSGTHE